MSRRRPLGREVRDSELFGNNHGREMRDEEIPWTASSALGREVRDEELFRSAPTLGRELRDNELFGSNPSERAKPPKRTRLASVAPLRSHPIAPTRSNSCLTPLHSEVQPVARPSALTPLRSGATPAIVPMPKRPRTVTLAAWERRRAVAGPSARTVVDIDEQFDAVPWRAGRSRVNQLNVGGVGRLSELCLSRLRERVRSGVIRDISQIPDDFAHALLNDSTLQNAAILKRIEVDNPTLLAPLEAAWARLCLYEFEVDTLPPGIHSWRQFHEIRTRDEKDRLQQAAARLRLRYAETDATRQVATLPSSLQPLPPKRRRVVSDVDPPYMPSQSLISRLRLKVRRERAGRR